MNNSNFVHLHNHSEYSEFDGLAKLDKFVFSARKMGFRSIALTDHGNMGGVLRFRDLCHKKEDKKGKEIKWPIIKPIIGCEMYMSRDRFARSKKEQPEGAKGNYHLILLVKNWEGYKNLCYLSQKSYTEGFYMKPRIDFDLLSQHHEGLICSTACLKSIINMNLLHDRYDIAKKCVEIFKDIFEDDFFLEVMYHGLAAENSIMGDIFKLGKETSTPIIATNDVHYITQEEGNSQEVLMCMSSRTSLTNPKHLRHSYNEYYLKSADEMSKIFGNHKEVLTNTLAIAERIDDNNIKNGLFSSMRLPVYNVPDEYDGPQEYLSALAWDGMKKRGWDKSQPHIDALEKELH
ncbi:MAG: PHP domain-containing protein, partial [Elusimicrobiota bacterium]